MKKIQYVSIAYCTLALSCTAATKPILLTGSSSFALRSVLQSIMPSRIANRAFSKTEEAQERVIRDFMAAYKNTEARAIDQDTEIKHALPPYEEAPADALQILIDTFPKTFAQAEIITPQELQNNHRTAYKKTLIISCTQKQAKHSIRTELSIKHRPYRYKLVSIVCTVLGNIDQTRVITFARYPSKTDTLPPAKDPKEAKPIEAWYPLLEIPLYYGKRYSIRTKEFPNLAELIDTTNEQVALLLKTGSVTIEAGKWGFDNKMTLIPALLVYDAVPNPQETIAEFDNALALIATMPKTSVIKTRKKR